MKAHPQPVLVGPPRGHISAAPRLAASTLNDLFCILRKYQYTSSLTQLQVFTHPATTISLSLQPNIRKLAPNPSSLQNLAGSCLGLCRSSKLSLMLLLAEKLNKQTDLIQRLNRWQSLLFERTRICGKL